MAAPHAPVTKKRTCRIAASANATELTLAGVPLHLEVNKVRRTSTQDRYNAVVETFLFWCRSHYNQSTDCDCLLTAYLNELYAQGADVSAAEYTFAAFRCRLRQARHQGFGASHTGSRATATWPLRRCGSRLPAWLSPPSWVPC